MTTRRRRAGSESFVEEPSAPGAPVFLTPTNNPLQLQSDPPQSSYTLFPQVCTNFYRKTVVYGLLLRKILSY